MKDNFECLFPLFYCFENCDGEPFCFDTTQTVPIPCGGSLSAVDFDRSEWEIMYPLFVEEGLVDPFKHVSQKDA
jgi:hypothetical protein